MEISFLPSSFPIFMHHRQWLPQLLNYVGTLAQLQLVPTAPSVPPCFGSASLAMRPTVTVARVLPMAGSQTHRTIQSRQSSLVLVFSASAARGSHGVLGSWCHGAHRDQHRRRSHQTTSITSSGSSSLYSSGWLLSRHTANRSGRLVGGGRTKLIGCRSYAPRRLDNGQLMNLTTEINPKDEKGSQIACFHETFLF
jgi:hypothetical protein